MEKKIVIVGIGPGDDLNLTLKAREALLRAELLIGAPRMLEAFGTAESEKYACISPEKIAEYIDKSAYTLIAVLMSGDAGFYSGAKKLIPLLAHYKVETLPGIASLQYLCAKLNISWDDVHVASAHGRRVNIAAHVALAKRTFFLTGGETSAQSLCAALEDCGMGDARVTVGSRLSYSDERIVAATAKEAAEQSFDPLSVVLVEQVSAPRWPYATGAIPDELFIRGDVPMTKADVRLASIARLRLKDGDTVYDIGAGTGSVAVETALAIPNGRVFAIECDAAALLLIEKNRRAFGAYNIEIKAGEAPKALNDLPVPDAVFIGGSGGSLEAIFRAVLAKNPRVRMVINAITLETLARSTALMEEAGFEETEAVQLGVARVKKAGSSHMLLAQNPVFILSGRGVKR